MPSAFPNEKSPRKARKKPVPASLAKMYDRALLATDEEVHRFQPTELIVKISEAYLSGHLSHKEIAEHVGVGAHTVSQVMRDPVTSAWVAKHMHSIVRQRLGLIDAAMFHRALTGDVSAAKLMFERYGKMVKRSMHVQVGGATDFSQFETDDLKKIIAAKQAAAGEVVDV